ncbi:serine threonine-kinase [Micractinium conductrix]|uniref:Serine threonine-kinase n=1 Tax=Micractinium conductrix TaxID=554055 RepID=A0A2P6VA76_9CHLO|nr:serine threonine-kinase [Micractinium conductrix]|eukprot:PSC70996.1 serine threonine-kinase [Micractinium conductrix]
MSGPVPSWPDYPGATVSIRPGNEGLCSNGEALPAAPTYTDATTATSAVVKELPLCPGVPTSAASTGLSGGAIAGIAIGGVAAAAAVLAGAALLLRRRRARQAVVVAASSDSGKMYTATLQSSASPKLTPSASTRSPSTGSDPHNPFAAGPPKNPGDSGSSSGSLPLSVLRGRGSSDDTGVPAAEQARLQAKLEALQKDAPAWLISPSRISPSRISLDQGAGGRLVLLGSGAYGRVYKGWLHPAGHAGGWELAESEGSTGASLAGAPLSVAVKVIDVGDVNAFLKEAPVMQQLNGGPHTVHLHGACVSDQQLIVVMELLEGGDLRAALSSDTPPVWNAGGRQIALDIAAGLAWLHSQNVTHRDLKSKNFATYLSAGSSNFGGTLAWAAPEMLLAAPCTHKVDLYSLGVVLWEIATAKYPRRGDAATPPASDACPQGLSDLIGDCLSTEPARRPMAQQALERLHQL